MKLSEGVEQAIHCTAFLAGLSEDGVLSAAALAELTACRRSYLLKHLQAQSGADIVATTRGRKVAIGWRKTPKRHQPSRHRPRGRGRAPAFRCARVRQRGPKPIAAALLHKSPARSTPRC